VSNSGQSSLVCHAQEAAVIDDQDVHDAVLPSKVEHRRDSPELERSVGTLDATFVLDPGCYTQEHRCRRGGGFVAKLIEFYIPAWFHKSAKWVPPEKRGQVIEFQPQKKSA
jgi:hypothetical protein